MSDNVETKGACLCGAVTLAVKQAKTTAGACHCGMCRKWSGAAFMAVDCGTQVTLSGEENVSTFASSMWAERAFCSKCGSNLYYKVKQSGQYIVSAGILELEGQLELDHQIFIDEKPAYYDFANHTENMTGAEVFAQFMPKND